MATVYRKTGKGQSEISTRRNQLPMRLRSALIMVDGKRSDEELVRMILGDAQGVLKELLEAGYIEVISVLAQGPPLGAAGRAAADGPDSRIGYRAQALQRS